MIIIISNRSSPSSFAKAPSERLGSSHFGLSPLHDFHSIEFRPADIPVWLNASRERLLRASRPLRLRLRCQSADADLPSSKPVSSILSVLFLQNRHLLYICGEIKVLSETPCSHSHEKPPIPKKWRYFWNRFIIPF